MRAPRRSKKGRLSVVGIVCQTSPPLPPRIGFFDSFSSSMTPPPVLPAAEGCPHHTTSPSHQLAPPSAEDFAQEKSMQKKVKKRGIDRASPRKEKGKWSGVGSGYQGEVCTDQVPPGPSFLGTAPHITSLSSIYFNLTAEY
jgi:hypothetical protein